MCLFMYPTLNNSGIKPKAGVRYYYRWKGNNMSTPGISSHQDNIDGNSDLTL